MTNTEFSFPELAVYSQPDHPLAGRYLIERELGSGGMAYVFAARDLKHGRTVAVKVLRSEYGSTVNAERFTREIQIAAGLTHPNILPVHDSGSADGLLYYVMPYVEAGTLVDRMRREARLPLGDVRRITREIGAALQFAHDHGFVHRDIKPANVLLPGGLAVVADFGLARAIEGDSVENKLTRAGVGLGTPTYMSPEQGAGENNVDARSDQYSLACTVYEMLAARPPFAGPSYQRLLAQHISEPPPPLRTIRPEIPESVETAITRALSKKREDRFPSVDEFLRALDGDLKGQTASWGIRSPARYAGARARNVIAIAALLVVAGGLWLTRSRIAETTPARAGVDANLVAVAPFVVLGNSLAVWREGIVDVLARDFDGAGPLRTVSPSTVMRLFKDRRADRLTAVDLAKQSGAGIVVYGQLLDPGRDSVKASVTVYDVARDTLVGEFSVSNASTNMDLVVDSIAMNALRQLGKTRPIAATRRAFFGSRSLPALKVFLQGEQLYRRNELNAAQGYYEQAIGLDSNFALAYRRMRGVLRGKIGGGEFDTLSLLNAARAGAANHGMSARDSLLILADSLAAVHRVSPPYANPVWIESVRRRLSTLAEAAKRYPDDPEVLTELAEAEGHYGERLGIDGRTALRTFLKALALDSTYGPAFYHAIELSAHLQTPDSTRAILDRYTRVNPTDKRYGLLAGALRGAAFKNLIRDPMVRDSSAATVLRSYADDPDTYELFYLDRLTRVPTAKDSADDRQYLNRRYLFRGELRAANANSDSTTFRAGTVGAGIAFAYAKAGVISPAQANAIFDRVVRDKAMAGLPIAFAWWYRQHNVDALRKGIAVAAEAERRRAMADTGLARYARLVGEAYTLLAQNDTTGALRGFLALPDSAASYQFAPLRLDVARLLIARKQTREAAVYLDSRPPHPLTPTLWEVEWQLERARVAEALGDSKRARDNYALVVRAWSRADSELQPTVTEAREAVARLSKAAR